MADIKLETKLAGDIPGRFFIPSYQRGYRWGKKEVRLMLQDILDNGDRPYSLQPIVVRNLGDCYEVVDGQQRLTTLYLIFMCFRNSNMGFSQAIPFSLKYDTRKKSEEFLAEIKDELRDDNIDFFHIANAYDAIRDFFNEQNNPVLTMYEIFRYLANNVRVIWYEIPEWESAVDLFTRLNIGKIPLTSSELVKALFLRQDANDIIKHQDEISLQWDNIERDLHDESLWGFLTNEKPSKYPTRIDLVLNLMAPKPEGRRDELHTFFYFDQLTKQGMPLYEIWQEIQHTFLMLKEWRYTHELYHKIGYLIASKHLTLYDIFHETRMMKKSEFVNYLDEKIRESIKFGDKHYDDLSYDRSGDHDDIERMLLLFNVESVRTLDENRQWFPFDKHKKANWSLEHIHARHSEGLDSNDKRSRWLRDHIDSLAAVSAEDNADLISRMRDLLSLIAESPKTTKVGELFEPLQAEVTAKLSDGGADYIHRIGNMALLDCADNAALSNYVFDAKRNMVIQWDKSGKYIPFCTKMAFFKYYTPSADSQLHFWGAKDRKAYIEALNLKLANYLKEPFSTNY